MPPPRTGTPTHIRRLPPTLRAPASARSWMRGLPLSSELESDALLVVSEMVTNSVRHAHFGPGDWIELAVELRPDALRIEVSDPGPGVPDPPSAPLRSGPGGRGLFLIAHLGDRHGTRAGPPSAIWVEIDR